MIVQVVVGSDGSFHAVVPLMGTSPEALEQRILSHIKRETLVGGKRVTRQELPELPKDASTTVHRVKVSLYGAKPPVWRRLEIPSAMPLNLVHAVLQVAFGWHDYHLHAFETVCGQFGSPDQDYDWAERQDEATATLAQVAGAERAKAVYSYDFRDDWRHDIVVEKIIPAEPGVAYPRCTGGRRMDRRRVAEGSGSSMSSLPNSATCSPSPS